MARHHPRAAARRPGPRGRHLRRWPGTRPAGRAAAAGRRLHTRGGAERRVPAAPFSGQEGTPPPRLTTGLVKQPGRTEKFLFAFSLQIVLSSSFFL